MKGGYSFVLFLFLYLGFSTAIIVQSSVSVTSEYVLFDSFGFLSGGSIQFYLQVYVILFLPKKKKNHFYKLN